MLVTTRRRWIAYGSAAAVAVAGMACAAVSASKTADIVGYAIMTLAFGAIVLLVFYEIGLSEDRDREAEEQRKKLDDMRL